jgi:hypothetical protein
VVKEKFTKEAKISAVSFMTVAVEFPKRVCTVPINFLTHGAGRGAAFAMPCKVFARTKVKETEFTQV